MRNAFTLIEVLVATVIATIAGMALLQMNSNNTHLFKQIQYRSSNSEPISIIALHSDKKYHRTTKSLYDILDNAYDIKNDDLRKYLKDTKIDYREKVIDIIAFGESEMDEASQESQMGDMSERSEMMEKEMSTSAPIIQFELIQIVIKSDESKNAILTARMFE